MSLDTAGSWFKSTSAFAEICIETEFSVSCRDSLPALALTPLRSVMEGIDVCGSQSLDPTVTCGRM